MSSEADAISSEKLGAVTVSGVGATAGDDDVEVVHSLSSRSTSKNKPVIQTTGIDDDARSVKSKLAGTKIVPLKHSMFARYFLSRPIVSIPEQREQNPQDLNWRYRFLFSWVEPTMRKGYDRVLVPEDVPFIPSNDRTDRRFAEYQKYLKKYPPGPDTQYREIWAILYANRYRLAMSIILQLISTASQSAQSVVSRYLLEEAEKLTDGAQFGGYTDHGPVSGYAIASSALSLIATMTGMYSMFLCLMNTEYTRTLVMCVIHDKMLRLGPQQRQEFSAAKITSISGGDARRGSMFFMEAANLMCLPVALGVTIGLLVYFIGVAGLAGIGLMILICVLNGLGALLIGKLRKASMPFQDKRISLTRETVKNLSTIKFYGWEVPFWKLITKIRSRETTYIRRIQYAIAGLLSVSLSSPNLAGLLSFAVKIIIGTGLSPAAAFPALSLFQMFMPVMAQTSIGFSSMADALVAAKRMNAFFRLPEIPSYVERDVPLPRDIIAVIENGKFGWKNKETAADDKKKLDLKTLDEKNNNEKKVSEKKQAAEQGQEETDNSKESKKDLAFFLEGINVTLRRGTMNLVIGAVGTGKSSLLGSFLNVIPKYEGRVLITGDLEPVGVLSYWAKNATIRDNILFGRAWDEQKFREVIKICDLQSDLDQFPLAESTEVGENGVTLSGGQKARLALARCLYTDEDFIILDDVLSAMDSRVGSKIYSELLKLVHVRNKTILFSTNNLKCLPRADSVIVLSADGLGHAEQMTPSEVNVALVFPHDNDKNSPSESATSTPEIDESTWESNTAEDVHEKVLGVVAEGELEDSAVAVGGTQNLRGPATEALSDAEDAHSVALSSPKDDPEMQGGYVVSSQMQEENRSVGTVKTSTLIEFFGLTGFSGLVTSVFALILVMSFACSSAMTTVVLNWWTSNKYHMAEGFNIGMYALVAALVGIFYATFSMMITTMTTHSSNKLLSLALKGIYDSPSSYLQRNPLGRIIMRFTEDIVNLDTRFIALLRIIMITFFNMLASMIVVFVYVPWSLICVLPIVLCSLVMLAFYRPSSRELNRCKQLYDSKAMAALTENIEGQEIIVGYGQKEHSQSVLHERMDEVISANMCNEGVIFWIGSRSAILVECLVIVTIYLAVFQVFHLNASEVGSLIAIVPSIQNSLVQFFPLFSMTENQLNSVERLHEYANDLPKEGQDVRSKLKSELEPWTAPKGHVEFKNVDLQYREGLPLALNNVSIDIPGGMKVGICGRTGAGKSTLMSALFRLFEVSNGEITIDGQDISELPLATLRKSLAIIPQQPTLFQGTIRSNLDPFEEHSDKALEEALNQAGLDTDSDKFALSAPVEAEGVNYSLGQRQMISLVRAIVRQSRIVVLDEATAAVDHATDMRIQATMKTVFKDRTVLCIAHRLETILDYDKIVVMGPGGHVLEYGTPSELLESENGVFRSMCNDAGISSVPTASDPQ